MRDETQIQTHMCYSEFGDIMRQIQEMDADVLLIEAARSKMELLEDWKRTGYENEIGPGLYDIHSPRIPSTEEMVELLRLAAQVLEPEQIWVDPDCGLKTRRYEESSRRSRTWSPRPSSCAKSWSPARGSGAPARRADVTCRPLAAARARERRDLPVQEARHLVHLAQRLRVGVRPEEHVVPVAEHPDRQGVLLGDRDHRYASLSSAPSM